ncbi:MAG: rhodanese-like domain-containing protein [Clostridia bacterium]|nr:rhodanese-like domain-containing protein [Clostridia bacterium]
MRRGVCKNILLDTATQLINNYDVKVIDVREKNESKKSLPNSINIPISEFPQKIREIVPNKNQSILVYCSTGSRSIYACQVLADMGYNKVYNLQGGFK